MSNEKYFWGTVFLFFMNAAVFLLTMRLSDQIRETSDNIMKQLWRVLKALGAKEK